MFVLLLFIFALVIAILYDIIININDHEDVIKTFERADHTLARTIGVSRSEPIKDIDSKEKTYLNLKTAVGMVSARKSVIRDLIAIDTISTLKNNSHIGWERMQPVCRKLGIHTLTKNLHEPVTGDSREVCAVPLPVDKHMSYLILTKTGLLVQMTGTSSTNMKAHRLEYNCSHMDGTLQTLVHDSFNKNMNGTIKWLTTNTQNTVLQNMQDRRRKNHTIIDIYTTSSDAHTLCVLLFYSLHAHI